jgi:hypothetical protein
MLLSRSFDSHTNHGAAIYGAPWIPSIYPSHVSIFLPAPWIRHGIAMINPQAFHVPNLNLLASSAMGRHPAVSHEMLGCRLRPCPADGTPQRSHGRIWRKLRPSGQVAVRVRWFPRIIISHRWIDSIYINYYINVHVYHNRMIFIALVLIHVVGFNDSSNSPIIRWCQNHWRNMFSLQNSCWILVDSSVLLFKPPMAYCFLGKITHSKRTLEFDRYSWRTVLH